MAPSPPRKWSHKPPRPASPSRLLLSTQIKPSPSTFTSSTGELGNFSRIFALFQLDQGSVRPSSKTTSHTSSPPPSTIHHSSSSKIALTTSESTHILESSKMAVSKKASRRAEQQSASPPTKSALPGQARSSRLSKKALASLSTVSSDNESSSDSCSTTPTTPPSSAERTARKSPLHYMIPSACLPAESRNTTQYCQPAPPSEWLPNVRCHELFPKLSVEAAISAGAISNARGIVKSTDEDSDGARLSDDAPPLPSPDVHVFIDLSNILCGFYDTLKEKSGLRQNQRIAGVPFPFRALRDCLERNRKAVVRELCGSVADPLSDYPQYVFDAQAADYHTNMLTRVPKSPKPKRQSSYQYYSSDSDSPRLRNGEQCVDELLQLKMSESILEHDAGIMVLATGDAAQAEFSEGFLKKVEQALKHGWLVEIHSFKRNMSSAWSNPAWLAKYNGRVKIFLLDPCVDEFESSVAVSNKHSGSRRKPNPLQAQPNQHMPLGYNPVSQHQQQIQHMQHLQQQTAAYYSYLYQLQHQNATYYPQGQ